MAMNGRSVDRGDLLELGKAVHDKLHDSLDKRTKQLQQEVLLKTGQDLLRGLDFLTKRLDDANKEMLDKDRGYHKQLDDLRKELDGRLLSLEKMWVAGLQQLVEAVKALPSPTVGITIPDSAILVQQLPSHVDVHLPEMAPNITLPQLNSVVNMPEMSPVFNMPQLSPVFQVPEQQSIVNVALPPPKRLRKLFSYDQNGRPLAVTEEEIEEK